MKESWKNFSGQRTRETKFSNGMSFLFTDTKLKMEVQFHFGQI